MPCGLWARREVPGRGLGAVISAGDLVTAANVSGPRAPPPHSWMEPQQEAGLRVPGTEPDPGPRHADRGHDVVSIRSDRSRTSRGHKHGAGAGSGGSAGGRSLYNLPPKKTLWRRFKDAFRTIIAFVFSNVGICVLVLVYLILGRFRVQS